MRPNVGIVALALGMMLHGTPEISQTSAPTEGPAVGRTPGWFLQGSFPDPTGRTIVDPGGHVTLPPRPATTSAAPLAPAEAATPWMASGQAGQFLKLDRDGHVLGAIGNGMGMVR